MRSLHFAARSLRHHWRMHVAVGLGVAVGASVLTGALLVGDSMRGSLRDLALDRLGSTDSALIAPRFVLESLADRLWDAEHPSPFKEEGVAVARAESPDNKGPSLCPLISLTGSLTQPERGTRASGASVFGVDPRFWQFHGNGITDPVSIDDEKTVVLNDALATELGAAVGDDVLLHFGKTSTVSTDTLLGRRDETTATLRLTVQRVIPSTGVGAFSLRPQQGQPKNAFVPLKTLQRASQQLGRVNTIIAHSTTPSHPENNRASEILNDGLAHVLSLEDLGLTLRTDERFRYLALESESIFLDPVVSRAAISAANDLELEASPLLAYLVNSITTDGANHGVPYSTAVGIDPQNTSAWNLVPRADPESGHGLDLHDGEVTLNAWASEDLNATVGDRITLTYFLTTPTGEYVTRSESFLLASIVPFTASVVPFAVSLGQDTQARQIPNHAADPGLVPPYKGITDTENLADWNAPFPLDLTRIRSKDEDYWRDFRTTPKVFLTLNDARRLWGSGPSPSETATSIRLHPHAATKGASNLDQTAAAFRERLQNRLAPPALGLSFQPVRQQALQAAEGSTDFSMLFLGFSGFLIAVSAMLSVLLFRLGIERRAADVGLLLAVGLTPRAVLRLLVTEASLPLVVGTAVGVALAGGYAWLMLAGLRTIWSAAANAPFLRSHAEPTSYAIGAAASLILGPLTIAASLRRFVRLPINRLLRRDTEASRPGRRPRFVHPIIPAALSFVSAIGLAVAGTRVQAMQRAGCFFGSGAAAVAGFVLSLRACLSHLRRSNRASVRTPTWSRFGVRNVARNAGRSILIAGLVASASFILVAVDAFRLGVEPNPTSPSSGTGGFSSIAETTAPLPYDLSERTGWESLNLGSASKELLRDATIMPFRFRAGDSTSCLNLYQKGNPRILGAPPAMIARGGFRFSAAMPLSESDSRSDPDSSRANPWTLLERSFDDGAIPAIGDEAAVLWQLKSGLGQDLMLTDERGADVRLRFVGLLSNSILQGELIILDSHLRKLFPSIEGHGFFLIASPVPSARKLDEVLEADLARFGFDAQDAGRRLAEFQAVQNTYLSTFQLLGGLGLVLGSIGLAAILVRNVWERRRELALLQTLGLGRRALVWYVLVENLVLLVFGLTAGFVSAILAIAPALVDGSGSPPWSIIAWVSLGSLVVTLATGLPAVYLELRSPLLPALRNE